LILKKEFNRKYSLFSWLLSFICALFAVITGLLISSGGHYIEANLSTHKIFGFILLFITFLSWIIRKVFKKINRFKLLILNIISIILLTITGHYGGNLTHEQEYLKEIIPLASNDNKEKNHLLLTDKKIDSVVVYDDLIHPIFSNKCISCHNNVIQRGGLDMSNLENLLKGGNAGNPINPMNPRKSLLFERMTLPIQNIKSMPPDGELVSYDEINLILWWMSYQKRSKDFLDTNQLSNETKLAIQSLYNLNFDPLNWDEKLTLDKLDIDELNIFDKDTYEVNFISENQKFISIKFLKNELNQDDFLPLIKLSNHIVYLKFPELSLNKNLFNNLKIFNNLIKLDIKNNPLEDEDLTKLTGLENLEVLNLIGTSITEKSIKTFNEFKNLKRVYLWKTKISSNSIEFFNQSQSEVELIGATLN